MILETPASADRARSHGVHPAPVARTGAMPGKQRAYAFGVKSEAEAAALLVSKGYEVLDSRVLLPSVEVDLVVQKGDVVAFVEVKARDTIARALEAVGPRRRRRMIQAAWEWLSRHPDHAGHVLRFDIVAIAPGRLPRHLPNAFWDEG